MTLFSSDGNTIEGLRNLLSYKNYVDADDDGVNLVQKTNEEEENQFDQIQELISEFLDVESQIENQEEIDDINIKLMTQIHDSFNFYDSYPKTLIPNEFFEKCFVLLGENNPNVAPDVFSMLMRIIQCFYDTNISQYFTEEVITMIIGICNDETNYSLSTRKLGLETLFEIYFSSTNAISLSYHHFNDIFMLTKKIADQKCYKKMIDLFECVIQHFDSAKLEIDVDLFIDFIKESCSWVDEKNLTTFIRCVQKVVNQCPESITTLFSSEETQSEFLNFIIRLMNSQENQIIAYTLPIIEFLIAKTEILSVSHIDMFVDCARKLWKTERYSKDSIHFAGLIIEHCPFGVDIMIKHQLIEDISDIFEVDSPINNLSKIEAAKVLCFFVIKSERSQLDQVNCDRIIEILEEIDSMEVIDEQLINEATDKLIPPE